MSEKLLLERVTAAAEERHLSQNTLTAYRRTWIKAIAWAAAEGLALETLPSDSAGEFYEEATRGWRGGLWRNSRARRAFLVLCSDSCSKLRISSTAWKIRTSSTRA